MSLDAPDLVGERLEPVMSSTERAALFLGGRSVLSLSISLGYWLSSRWLGTGGPTE